MTKILPISNAKTRLKETRAVLGDPTLIRQIRRSKRFYAAGGKGLSFEEVFGDRVRPRKRRKRTKTP